MKKRKRDQTVRVWALGLLWITLLFSIGSAAIAAEEGAKEYQPSLFATIQGKATDAIMTSKQRFAIFAEASIFNMQGKKMTIRELPVPCEAEVQYRPQSFGDPTVTKIVVRKVFPGATTGWTNPAPE